MALAKPASASDIRINLVGLASLGACIWYLVQNPLDRTLAVPLLLVATAAPILLLDVLVGRVHRRASTGIDWSAPRERDASRVVTKWIGAGAAASLVVLGYFAYPEYMWPTHLFGSYEGFYFPYYEFLDWFGPLLIIVGLASLAWLDAYLVDPRDMHWHLGAIILGQRADVDATLAADLIRTWVIRGFFLPLFFIYAGGNLVNLYDGVAATDRPQFEYWFEVIYSLGLLVETTFATLGCIVIWRVLDTHPRATDFRGSGWVSTLIFYQPFLSVFATQYLAYQSHTRWGQWLAPQPELKTAWGAAILIFVWISTLSAVAYGFRLTNLTNRGILTGWTYAWTKHPMYVATVASLALIWTPFLHEGSTKDVVQRVLMFAVMAALYWVRARTEERHLSRDPDYVRYALYMNDHSLFAPLGRLFPFLRYKPPPEAALTDAPPR